MSLLCSFADLVARVHKVIYGFVFIAFTTLPTHLVELVSDNGVLQKDLQMVCTSTRANGK